LSIAQRAAALLKSDLEVDSEVGKGSVFSLTVLAGDHRVATGALRAFDRRASNLAASATILIVEDDASVRVSMERFLRAHSHSVVSAASLEEALSLLDTLPRLDVLITDLHLPSGKTGFDVISSVRELWGERIPAIMLSGDTSKQVGLSNKADVHFVSKPIYPDTLAALVQELNANRETPKESTETLGTSI